VHPELWENRTGDNEENKGRDTRRDALVFVFKNKARRVVSKIFQSKYAQITGTRAAETKPGPAASHGPKRGGLHVYLWGGSGGGLTVREQFPGKEIQKCQQARSACRRADEQANHPQGERQKRTDDDGGFQPGSALVELPGAKTAHHGSVGWLAGGAVAANQRATGRKRPGSTPPRTSRS
jgi:hypothetical protein